MKQKTSSLITLISVFFFWGFVAASNTILIPLFKKNFELMQWQSQLVDFAFYIAYTFGALIYFVISLLFGDPLNKIGYKKGLVLGLIISAMGALGFVPAAGMGSFALMLTSLFVVALGFALQQIVANPYVIALGDPATGSHRVSLAGGINSFGTMIGPLLLALAIFGNISGSSHNFLTDNSKKTDITITTERSSNKSEIIKGSIHPWQLFTGEHTWMQNGTPPPGSMVLCYNLPDSALVRAYKTATASGSSGLILYASTKEKGEFSTEQATFLKKEFPGERLPILSVTHEDFEKINHGGTLEVEMLGTDVVKTPYIILCGAFLLFALLLGVSRLPAITSKEHRERNLGALKYPQLLLGMLAIFTYVGVEVTIQSNLPELMKQPEILGRAPEHTVHFISLYWGSLMIGRWTGAITVFNLSRMWKNLLTVLVPVIAFGVIIGVNYLKMSAAGNVSGIMDMLYYFPFVVLLIIGFFLGREKPARTLMLFGSMAAFMMLVGLFTGGRVALYAFMSGGLFCSIMWPCIFSLSIAGLGKYTNQGSSLLIMMIMGGAFIPPLQGFIADKTNIHLSYIIPVICFAYLAFYAWRVKGILRKQGIDYDTTTSSEETI